MARKLGEVILSLGKMPLENGLLVFLALIILTLLIFLIGPRFRLPTDHKKWSFGVLVISFLAALLRRGEAADAPLDFNLNRPGWDLNEEPYDTSSQSGVGAPASGNSAPRESVQGDTTEATSSAPEALSPVEQKKLQDDCRVALKNAWQHLDNNKKGPWLGGCYITPVHKKFVYDQMDFYIFSNIKTLSEFNAAMYSLRQEGPTGYFFTQFTKQLHDSFEKGESK